MQTALEVGDSVPEVTIKDIHNYSSNSLKISDLKGKLVILDFWGINCQPCIEAFPKLEALQKAFGEEICIIPVTTSSKGLLDSTFKKRSKYSKVFRSLPRLPLITSDTLLGQLFPYQLYPHEVWINVHGKVQAISEHQYVTRENIEKMLSDDQFRLPEKKDFLSFDTKQAIFPQTFLSFPDRLKYYTAIMKYKPFKAGTQTFATDKVNNTMRFSRVGTLLDLIGVGITKFGCENPYNSHLFDFGKRVIMDVKDSAKYFFIGDPSSSDYENWRDNNMYVYERVMPPIPQDSIFKYLINDLKDYFGIKVVREKRKMACLVLELLNGDSGKLVVNRPTEELKDKYFTAKSYFDSSGRYYGYSTTLLRMELSKANKEIPYCFIDETGYRSFVKFDIRSPLNDLERLNKELEANYNVTLRKKDKEIEVLVIGDY
jgi:thiol-disulfide isomerase/thioredoxin